MALVWFWSLEPPEGTIFYRRCFRNAGDDEIKRAYKKRALIHHPDRHANATDTEKKEQEKKFKELGEAYGVLSDPKKKARYDNGQDMDDFDGGMSGKHSKTVITSIQFYLEK